MHELIGPQVGTLLKWHTLVPCLQPRNTQWYEIKGAGETVEMLRVPTSPQGEHSLAESRHEHWWHLPDVYVGAKNSTRFPNACWKNQARQRQMHVVLMLFRPLPNVGIQNFGMWGMYTLAKAYRSIENPLPIAESRTGKPATVTLKIQLDCSTVHDTMLWANIFMRSHLGCGIDSIFICLCRSHKYFKAPKAMQINRILKIRWNLTCQAQSTPKTVGILPKVFCTSGPNLVILAETGQELSRGQAKGWRTHTDTHTDRRRQRQCPKAKTGLG